jgi:pyruvate dehydrogenase E1 component
MKNSTPSEALLSKIIERVHVHAMNMIYLANHRDDIEKGDPKVGGHPTACSSALHLLSLLHLVTKNAQDFLAVKPHASPTDHSNNYLLRLFLEKDGTRMSDDRAQIAMKNLRHFSHKNEPVFQSYHSTFDADHWGFLPSGSVGIPPVNLVYLAHAYRMAEKHEHKVPQDAHFWALMGDAEYREGSLAEVLPEVSERGLGNVTWILDYNRQSLDGNRILNEDYLGGKDNDRVEKTALANGWDVIQLRHGRVRKMIFKNSPEGEAVREVLENALPDAELQSLIAKLDAKSVIEAFSKYDKGASKALKGLSEKQILEFLLDMGGHSIPEILEAFSQSKKDPHKPTLIIAHTIKGWNLRSAAKSANHSAMMGEDEVFELREKYGLKAKDLFAFERFEKNSDEDKFLTQRGQELFKGIQEIKNLRENNINLQKKKLTSSDFLSAPPKETQINLKMVPMAHTQWMLGQITAKLSRIADTPFEDSKAKAPLKPLTSDEKKLKPAADMIVTMAPDVGTSTNLNAAMDGRVFGPENEDFQNAYGVFDAKTPNITPHESSHSRFVRFDIAESNTMSCVGSYGKLGDFIGVPFIPVMTVYDFFIKRALDQLFYNLYWNAGFILVGTPSGVTLAPEGAQHAWKSDIQIPNGITWEPAFALELDWILTDAMNRQLIALVEGAESPQGNLGRSGVLIRGVTRALEQKEFLKRLKTHSRFNGLSDDQILEQTRRDCLEGGYYLVDHRGQQQYRPSENVVHIFTMGSLVTEALAASDKLLSEGIFANVIHVSSPDLLLGNLGEKTNYRHLVEGLGISGDLFVTLKAQAQKPVSDQTQKYPPQNFGPRPFETLTNDSKGFARLMTLGGRRVPIVSVHDGEPGLLDNIGSLVGTLQSALCVRKHSKSGRPSDIYAYHHIDAQSIVQECQTILEKSALSGVQIEAPLANKVF